MNLVKAITSVSLFSGTFVVIALSAVIALATSRLKPSGFRWTVLCAVPVLLAYCLYWSPVWLGTTQSDEYSAWALVCILPWSFSGILASSVIEAIVHRRFNAKTTPGV